MSFLSRITDPHLIITAIDNNIKFPEIIEVCKNNYIIDIDDFCKLVAISNSSSDLLHYIRDKNIESSRRMSFLKIFRRSVSPVLDTESTKKIKSISTESLVHNYGHTFKDINLLKHQFSTMTNDEKATLACLLGEYDTRGASGYILTDMFFTWFRLSFPDMLIEGPQGAGRDIELSSIFQDFSIAVYGKFPCDFIIRDKSTGEVLAIGFSRYDSTRGGAQSDDRTGGNSLKVNKLMQYKRSSGKTIKILFLSDGPGLAHRDTWEESQELDRSWGNNVRVFTMKIAHERVTREWLKE